jgi:hypothetical protein
MSIDNVNAFKLDLANFYKKVTAADHPELCRKIAKTLHEKLVASTSQGGTPVDTGWAAANWGAQVGREGVPTKPMGTYPEDAAGTHTRPIDLRAYFPDIEGVLATAGIAPFIWIFNNVPYIEALENGHSTQIAVGMMETALDDVQTFVDAL